MVFDLRLALVFLGFVFGFRVVLDFFSYRSQTWQICLEVAPGITRMTSAGDPSTKVDNSHNSAGWILLSKMFAIFEGETQDGFFGMVFPCFPRSAGLGIPGDKRRRLCALYLTGSGTAAAWSSLLSDCE